MYSYQKIIKKRSVRLFILKMLFWIPDKLMIRLQYRIKLKRKINFHQPKRFSEKIQLYKMHYKNPVLHKLVDKNDVREYLKDLGFNDMLVKKYGVYNKFSDIPFNSLPNEFIMKSTSGGGGTQVIKVNKNDMDISKLEKETKKWTKKISRKFGGREFAYNNLKGKIIIEELLKDNENDDIIDYKFLCFKGECKFVVVDLDRTVNHTRNIYDLNWKNLNIETDQKTGVKEIKKPINFDDMLNFAKKISNDFPFVRVDLFNINNKVYFGELTFYPWSGYIQFIPDEFDFILGDNFDENFKENY